MRRLWVSLAGLTALEFRRRQSSSHVAPTKNEEKRYMGKERVKGVVDVFLTIVCWISQLAMILQYI
jgi:hypothetical protein